jgi:hypothetical protein
MSLAARRSLYKLACTVFKSTLHLFPTSQFDELNRPTFPMKLSLLLLAYVALAMVCYVLYNNIAFLNQIYLSEFLEDINSNPTTRWAFAVLGDSAKTSWPPRPRPSTRPQEVPYCFRTANDREKLGDIGTPCIP